MSLSNLIACFLGILLGRYIHKHFIFWEKATIIWYDPLAKSGRCILTKWGSEIDIPFNNPKNFVLTYYDVVRIKGTINNVVITHKIK